MADDEKREDLFEDLDKFFAPIRDVDWPEDRPAEGGAPAPREPERAPEPPRPTPPARTPEPTQVFEEPPAPRGTVELPPIRIGPDDLDEPSAEDLERAAAFFAEPGGVGDEPEAVRTGPVTFDTSGEPPVALPHEERGSDDEDDGIRVSRSPSTTGEFGSITTLLGEIEGREGDAPSRPRTITIGPEGTEGPSWQDPTAVEVGSGDERRAGRNVPLAAATGFGLAALAIGTLWLGAAWFACFAGIAVIVGLGEWFQALQRADHRPAAAVGMASAALLLAAAYLRGEAAMLAMVPLSVIATFLWYLAQQPGHRREVVTNIATTLLGVGYIGVLSAYGMLILRLPGGEGILAAVIGLTIAYDTAAFFGGYLWGSRPLAASVSPKKSWEGAIGGTIAALALAIGAVAPAVATLDTIGRAAGLAVVVSVFAPLGDLAESILKRDLGLKDMGNILPGHGGVLDRIDALLFVLPASFIFLRLLGA